MRATLHALRDRLTVEEAVQFGAELPMLVRGFYYEGWTVSGKPVKERHQTQFFQHIEEDMRSDFEIDLEQVVRAVFKVLSNHISQGEIQDVRHNMPAELKELWC